MTRLIVISIAACMLSVSVVRPAFAASLEDMWAKVKSFTVETKDAALDSGRQLVRETDAKIKELQGKADKSSGDAKAAYERSIKDLKEKRDAAAIKLDEMGKATSSATGSAWDATKQGFSDAYKDLQQSYDKATGSDMKK